MRKMMLLFVALAAVFTLAGCQKAEPNRPLAVYSFHGENEQLTVSNGVIVISGGKDVFYGGDLEVKEDFSSDCQIGAQSVYQVPMSVSEVMTPSES